MPSPWLCSTQLTCSRNLVACKLISDQCGEPAGTNPCRGASTAVLLQRKMPYGRDAKQLARKGVLCYTYYHAIQADLQPIVMG